MRYFLHHNDTDGYASKYAAWHMHRNMAEYHSVNYNQPCPILDKVVSGDEVYVLDFSYPIKVIKQIMQKGAKLVVIDHHKTAKEKLGSYPWFIYDESKSGCVLSWNYFVGTKTPDILLTVQDWDLWQFKLPFTKEIHLVAECNKEDMKWWEFAADGNSILSITAIGEQLMKYHTKIVETMASHAWLGTFFGLPVAVSNVTYPFISDVNQKMSENFGDKISMTMTFFVDEDGKKVWSLRSNKVDVGEIAKQYGGGGHQGAAGMILSNEIGPLKNRVEINS